MLVPKRVKHRKVQRGSMKGRAKGGTRLNHGTWGIQALEAHWITNRQIEAARIAMTRCMKPVSYTHLDVYKRQKLSGSRPHLRGADGRLREGVQPHPRQEAHQPACKLRNLHR